MNSNNNKYALPAGVAGSLGLSLLFFFNHSSYASKHIISIIGVAITSVMLIVGILGRKHLKPWILPFIICMFLGWLLALLHGYFVYKNMKVQNFTGLLLPVMIIIFGYIATKQQVSISKDKKKIDTLNKKFVPVVFMSTIMEILMLYGIFIKHK